MKNLAAELVNEVLVYLTIDEIKICVNTDPLFDVLTSEMSFDLNLSERVFYIAYMTEGYEKCSFETYHAGVFKNIRDAIKALFLTVLDYRLPSNIMDAEEYDINYDDPIGNYLSTLHLSTIKKAKDNIDIDHVAELLTDMIDIDQGYERARDMVEKMCYHNYGGEDYRHEGCARPWLADSYYGEGWTVTLEAVRINVS